MDKITANLEDRIDVYKAANTIKLGEYVEYKHDIYLAFPSTTGMLHIVNPCSGVKLHVKLSSVQRTLYRPAAVIEYRNTLYVVTRKGNIFSTVTNRLMHWDDNHGIRKEMLDMVK